MDPGKPCLLRDLGRIMHVNTYLFSDWKEINLSFLPMFIDEYGEMERKQP